MRRVVYGQKLYYHDPQNDDFTHHSAPLNKKVDKNFRYEHRNIFFRAGSFLLYYLVAFPVLWVYCKLRYGVKVRGKKNLRAVKGGYVLYCNHTNVMDVAFTFVFATFPKRSLIVCSPNVVGMPGIRHIVKMLGALPVPGDLAALKQFMRMIDRKLAAGNAVVVMPEAHIWPYYTGVRDFPKTSFSYAAKNRVPAVPMSVTYRRPRGPFKAWMKPRVNITIGQPIPFDASRSAAENAQAMRDQTYQFMCENARKDNVALYEYIQVDHPVETTAQIKQLRRKHSGKAENV